MTTTPPTRTSNPPQPGKSWVVLDDGDGTINITLPLGFGKDNKQIFTFVFIQIISQYLILSLSISC